MCQNDSNVHAYPGARTLRDVGAESWSWPRESGPALRSFSKAAGAGGRAGGGWGSGGAAPHRGGGRGRGAGLERLATGGGVIQPPLSCLAHLIREFRNRKQTKRRLDDSPTPVARSDLAGQQSPRTVKVILTPLSIFQQ